MGVGLGLGRRITRNMNQSQIHIVPLTLPKANDAVRRWHRHHDAIPGGFAWFCMGAIADGRLVGTAICGRPTNRNNDDGQTCEVLRLATTGVPNACSALWGAAARAAKAIGCWRVITYTLTSETGASLRGAGWRLEQEDCGRSWWDNAHTRTPARSRPHMSEHKCRWGLIFREPIEWVNDRPDEIPAKQSVLDI